MPDKKELVNKLITIAINGITANSYRDEDIAKAFCQLPLSDLAEFWPLLSDPAKLVIIQNHQEELMAWVSSSREIK